MSGATDDVTETPEQIGPRIAVIEKLVDGAFNSFKTTCADDGVTNAELTTAVFELQSRVIKFFKSHSSAEHHARNLSLLRLGLYSQFMVACDDTQTPS